MKKFFILKLIIFLNIFAFSQNYKISVKIDGFNEKDTLYFGHHYGNQKNIIDLREFDENGYCIFSGEEKLESGIYFFVMPNKKFFEFLVDKDQEFFITNKKENLIENAKAENSKLNKLFFEFQRKIKNLKKEIAILQEKEKNDKINIEKEILILFDKIEKNTNEILEKYPETLLSQILKSMVELKIPNSLEKENEKYIYFKKHYFDNLDFSDHRLLQTPIFFNKIIYFFENIYYENADTLIKEVNFLMEKSKANEKVFKYVLILLKSYFDNSLKMYYENVFVEICEKYYFNEMVNWENEKNLKDLKKKLKKIKPTLIGKIAPSIILPNQYGEYFSLKEIEADIIILYFWTTDCEYCLISTQILSEKIEKLKLENKNIEIMAVYLGNENEIWEDAITNYNIENWINVYNKSKIYDFINLYNLEGTPQLFILDKNKKIIAKNIDAQIIEKVIESIIIDF